MDDNINSRLTTNTEPSGTMFSFDTGWQSTTLFDLLHYIDYIGGIFFNDYNDFWVPPLEHTALLKVSKNAPIILSRRNMAAEQIMLSPLLKPHELEAFIFNYCLLMLHC